MGKVNFACVIVVALSLTACAAEPRNDLLKQFVDELIQVTPGEGDFPSTYKFGEYREMVELTEPFSMAKYEVPQNLYELVMGNNPSRWKGPRNSVEMMTWAEAKQFCDRLTKLLHEQKLIAADHIVRLPLEMEWEYCCRAGTRTAYSFGDKAQAATDAGAKASILDDYGWHTGNAAGNDPPVGALKPNAWGFYDMHGYLWEFCGNDNIPDQDGKPACVSRSGSWKEPYGNLQSTSRKIWLQSARSDDLGFRCVVAKKSLEQI